MFNHTTAYKRFKEQTLNAIDFVLLVSYSVPALKAQIRAFEKGLVTKLPSSDFFAHDVSSTSRLRDLAARYKNDVACGLLISSFSYFESYVENALNEMIAFHGGETAFVSRAEQKDKKFLTATPASVLKHKRGLQDSPQPGKAEKYKAHTQVLTSAGYRFPSELLSSYGVRMLIQNLEKMRSVNIPDILSDGLHISLTETQRTRFHAIREVRNRIAHGDPVSLSVREARRMTNDLSKLAILVDQHLVEHYFVIEKFTV